MTARSVWVYVALVVGAFGLVAGLGALERNPQVLEGPREVAWGWLLGVEDIPPAAAYTTEIVLDPQAQTATVNGENVSISWGSYAETAYSKGFEFTATLQVLGVEYDATNLTIPFYYMNMYFPQVGMDFVYTHTDTDGDGNATHYYGAIVDYINVYTVASALAVPGDGAYHDFDISMKFTATMNTRYGTEVIGEKGQTHAKEGAAQDQLMIDGSSGSLVVSIDDSSVTITEDIGAITPRVGIDVTLNSWSDAQGSINYVGQDWMRLTDVSFNGAAIDASLLSERITADTPLGSATGEKLHVYGSGSTIAVEQDVFVGTALDWRWSGGIDSPIIHKGIPPVWDIDNGERSDLLVYHGGCQRYNAALSAWEYISDTVNGWAGTTITPDWGDYSWDPTPPPDGAIKTLAATSFWKDTDSMEDEGDDGAAGGTTPDFSGDRVIPISGWVLSAADRESTPYVDTIASIAHNATADLYGPADALGHADWVGTGSVTSPDAAGSFSVTGSGSLAVDLPSNFESRLDEVPSQNFPTGMSGAPSIYWYHKADVWSAYDGQPDQSGGTWSEPAEAVYCARGFPCLKLNFTTYPGAGDDELTVTVAGKTYTVTDTHVSDSTRQTDFSYSSTAFSYEYTCQLSGGVGYCYLAAPSDGTRDPDLEVVESITIEGFSGGAWVLAEPQWCADPSGTTEQVKFFEHWAYKDGGLSAVVDSACQSALMDSTEGNSGHDNTVETRTVRIFDYVVGASSGIDFTSAKSLEAMMNSVTNVCDAWTGTYNSAAAEAAFKDSDGVWLKTPSATDICPQVKTNVGNLKVACRVAQWTCAAGLVYDWRQTVGDYSQGAIHGPMLDADGNLARSTTGEKVWRYEDGAWALHDTPTSDAAAYWVSKSGEVYDAASALYDYGTGDSASSVTSTGRFAAREYAYATLAAGGAPGVPWLHWMAGGWLHIAVAQDGVVRYYWTHPFSSAPTLQDTGAHPFGETGGFSNPFITSYSCGWLLVGATNANGMRLSLSRDFGGSWEEIEGATLVSDLRDGCVAIQDGVLAACGWKDNTIIFRSASGTSYAAESLYIGGPTQATICAAVEDTRSQVLWVNGVLEALVEGVGYYRTRDWGTSWTQVPAPHIADGMTGGTCAFVDGEVLASGIEAGEVRVESAYRDDRTPEAFYIGGPTHIAVVEASMRNAVEAVHGERWVATGEDGLTLYRTRNPADGFAKII